MQTPFLLDDIVFEGPHLGQVCVLKFEDWDLADHKKFPHLATEQLMLRRIDMTTTMIELEMWTWIKGVEKVGLLNLLLVLHYHHALMTVFIIKQLLHLVHDECLWLEEPIHIKNHLIHQIKLLPYSGENQIDISEGKGGELAFAEVMKTKFKLEKKKWGYAISNINNLVVKVETQILTGKVMRKCCADEVPTLVIALVAQCAVGVQFNWADYLCGEFITNYRKT